MKNTDYNTELFSFLRASPTPFHAVKTMADSFRQQGFTELRENEIWKLQGGQSYYVTREQGAIVAFTLGRKESPEQGFRIIGAHTDSPGLQIKPKPDIHKGSFHQLGVEVYGGSLLAPWFDRDLSIAGRVCCRMRDKTLRMVLLDFKRPLLTIPSVAIHLNRDANSGMEINRQEHLPPILAQGTDLSLADFTILLQQQIETEHPHLDCAEILGHDLFCYDHQGPLLTGVNNELISSPRLDNLLSCQAALSALLHSDKDKNCLIFCANHEENGSLSATGAQGSFISAVFERILGDSQSRQVALSNSFLVSADNAHATHPNYTEKTDKGHEIHLNCGPVIKINANQRYSTSSMSAAIFKGLCATVNIPAQEFVMRSDMACGSTIGPMTAARLGVRAIDIGAPTLGMHSIRELTGAMDPYLVYRPLLEFFESDMHNTLAL